MSDQPPPPQPPAKRSKAAWLWGAGAAVLLIAIATVVVIVVSGGEDEADAQTVRFQQPVDVGPDPFLDKPADRRGPRKVKFTPSSPEVGSGPFGGSGSDLVCDRDLLIRSLKAQPEKLVEWARVLGVEPTIKAVGEYIAKLHPVTLVRDTRVTNHSYVDGRAVAFQSILAAGTAVLVDDYGNPVVRCRCGNPLLKPIFYAEATCLACPPRYVPPPACPYVETTTIRRRFYPDRYYTNVAYDEIFIRRFRSECYRAYPEPPRVRITDIYNPRLAPRPVRTPTPTVIPTGEPTVTQPTTNPAASFSPSSGPVCVPYTLSVSGFLPNRDLSFTLTRPDGVVEDYPMSTDGSGSGSYTFSPGSQCANDVQGTYTATVTDPSTGDSAQATVAVSGGDVGGGGDPNAGTNPDDLQCDPPRSQLEFEECVAAGRG